MNTQGNNEVYWQGRKLFEAGDYAASSALLEPAALSGNADAAVLLGHNKLWRDGTQKNRDVLAAKKWFLVAVELGNAEGQFQMGLLEDKEGNVREAFQLFEAASDQGHIPAAQHMGYLAIHEKGLTREEIDLGYQRTKWAADCSHPFAIRDLSLMLFTGKGVKRDVFKAIRFR